MSDDWEGRHHDHSTEVDPSWAVAQLVARNYTLAAILTDLIAELRHRHAPYRVCMECDDWYAGCEDHEHITVCLWCCTSHGYHSMDCADNHTGTTLAEHCVTVAITDRAEARMKGLFDE